MNRIKKVIAAGIFTLIIYPFFYKEDIIINTGSNSGGSTSSGSGSSGSGWDNILNPQYMRNDSCGNGYYLASRDNGSRLHKGVDIVCSEHQSVYAPFSGRITRSFNVMDYSTYYKGIELSDEQGTKLKIMYLFPDYSLIGSYVTRGQKIATCQKISDNYNCSSMIDHLHIELFYNGVNIDPTFYLEV